MSQWHPRQEPLLPPLRRSRRERLPLGTLVSIGSGVLAGTACALAAFLVVTAGGTDIDGERSVVSQAQAKPAPAQRIYELSKLEPAAAPPDFMPERQRAEWSMDLGGFQRHDHGHEHGRLTHEHGVETATSVDDLPVDVAVVHETPVELARLEPVVELEVEASATEVEMAALPAPVMEPVAPGGYAPQVAIVIDDVGNNARAFRRLLNFEVKPTLAFLPYPEATPAMARQARAQGFELFLHMPMQPKGPQDPGPEALTTDLDRADIRKRLQAALIRVPGAVGVNNHMGSAFTSHRDGMDVVMSEVRARGLVFLDSRTTSASVVEAAAAVSGAAYTARDVFLDHDPSPAAIRAQLELVERIARKYGSVIAIGHPYDSTLDVLGDWLPQAKTAGLEFVEVRDIVAQRHCDKQASGHCDPAIFVAQLGER